MTPDGAGGGSELALPDPATLNDLQTFVGRAKQLDTGGAIRLVAHGSLLAVYAAALHGGGGPTVLGLRVLSLAEPSDLDVTVPISGLTDRFALAERQLAERQPAGRRSGGGGSAWPFLLPVPPATVTGATWVGMLPPRLGWTLEGGLRAADLRSVARAGIDEVATGTPQVAGAAAVAKLRSLVWGRPLPGQTELPAGAAFAAEVFGFLGSRTRRGGEEVFDQNVDQDAVSLFRTGRWWRLSSTRGHVLVRPATTLV